MNQERCSRLQLESEILLISGAGVELRVPIRRCLLGEQMARLLLQTETGRDIAYRLVINGPQMADAGSPPPDLPLELVRVAFGPDLEAIHPDECTVQRCIESCSPSYKNILTQFGMHEAVVRETGDGCYEPPSEISVAMSAGEDMG